MSGSVKLWEEENFVTGFIDANKAVDDGVVMVCSRVDSRVPERSSYKWTGLYAWLGGSHPWRWVDGVEVFMKG